MKQCDFIPSDLGIFLLLLTQKHTNINQNYLIKPLFDFMVTLAITLLFEKEPQSITEKFNFG